MKPNQHQAGGKNNRPAVPKQARKATRPHTRETPAAAPSGPLAEEQSHEDHSHRLARTRDRLYDGTQRARGLFFLLTSHMECASLSTMQGVEPNQDEACGIMMLHQDITAELGKCHDELHSLLGELRGHDRAAAPDGKAVAK